MEDGEEQGQKVLIVLAIELGDQNKKQLKIYPNSNPDQLAYDFCLQNNLDYESLQNLTAEIKNVLNNNKSEGQNEEYLNSHQEVSENKNNNQKTASGQKKKEEISTIPSGNKEEEEDHSPEPKEKNKNKYSSKENKENEEQKNSEPEKYVKPNYLNMYNNSDKKTIENQDKNESAKESGKVENFEKEEVKKEESEAELEKEEEVDQVYETNNNEQKEIPTYLAPTESSKQKKRQIVPPKPEPEFPEFITRFKKQPPENYGELPEEQISKLNIYQNNQKYLPKDYYEQMEGENFGDKLYHKEIRLKEEAMEKIRNKIKKENEPFEKNCTFSPVINDYNLKAIINRRANKLAYNDEEKILYYKDYLQAKIENTRNKFCEDLDKEKTFSPKLNAKSLKMENNKNNNNVKRYEQLYHKKVDLKTLEEKMYDPNMFKPKINKNYKAIKNSTLTFEERQKVFQEKKDKNKNKLETEAHANIDHKTGKKYFQPTINKNKKYVEKSREGPIYDSLYKDSESYKLKKKELVDKLLNEEKCDKEFKASNASSAMYDKQKNISFNKMFNSLDKDSDGKISKDDFRGAKIPRRLMKIISPVYKDLDKKKGTLNFEDFVSQCNEIYGCLDYADKKEIYRYSIPGNQKSVYDSEKYRPNRTFHSGHDKNYSKNKGVQNKMTSQYYMNDALNQQQRIQHLK